MTDRLNKDKDGNFSWEGEELYVIVDQGACYACGSCMCWSPDVFTYDSFSIAQNRLDNNTGTKPIPKAVWEDVLPTLRRCPIWAIKGSDKPFTNFRHTKEFGTESPENPNINYEMKEHEWTVNELTDNKLTPTSNEYGKSTAKSCGCGSDHNKSGCGCGGNCGCGSHSNDTVIDLTVGCGCGGDSKQCSCGAKK
ncbi:Ferredoxin [compost metagenome]